MKRIILLLITGSLAGCFGISPEKTGKEGMQLPDFTLLQTDGITSLNTRDIAAGKPVALFYFTPYCPYCKAQTEEIMEEMEDLKEIQFYFVSIYPLAELKKFNQTYQLTKFPNIVTCQDTAQFIAKYFEMPGVPYMAIYGKDKKLNQTFVGKISSNQLKRVAEQ